MLLSNFTSLTAHGEYMLSESKTLKLIPVMAMEETMNETHIPELKNKQMCFLNMERKCENEFLYSP